MKIEIELFCVKKNPCPDSMDLLMWDKRGTLYKGYKSYIGQSEKFEYISGERFPQNIEDVVYWAYLPEIPVQFENGIITHDDWIILAAKNGMLK